MKLPTKIETKEQYDIVVAFANGIVDREDAPFDHAEFNEAIALLEVWEAEHPGLYFIE